MYEGMADLIEALGRLPGIGPKSAQRIAFHILDSDPEDVTRLAEALREAKARVKFCEQCGQRHQNQTVQYLFGPAAGSRHHLRGRRESRCHRDRTHP